MTDVDQDVYVVGADRPGLALACALGTVAGAGSRWPNTGVGADHTGRGKGHAAAHPGGTRRPGCGARRLVARSTFFLIPAAPLRGTGDRVERRPRPAPRRRPGAPRPFGRTLLTPGWRIEAGPPRPSWPTWVWPWTRGRAITGLNRNADKVMVLLRRRRRPRRTRDRGRLRRQLQRGAQSWMSACRLPGGARRGRGVHARRRAPRRARPRRLAPVPADPPEPNWMGLFPPAGHGRVPFPGAVPPGSPDPELYLAEAYRRPSTWVAERGAPAGAACWASRWRLNRPDSQALTGRPRVPRRRPRARALTPPFPRA